MTILQEILTWSQGLPAWQSDTIARLFGKQSLSQQDLYDLYALLKSEHGILDPKGRVAKRLQADQVPSGPSANSHVELLAMKDLCFVNAIADNQRLPFGAKGLTLIYGDNGSGKSGYSRVLKRACRARDQSETIHPKATLKTNQVGTAKATFELLVNGSPESVVWTDGKSAPTDLSAIAIFDSRCARAYLDDEDDFSYVPYGLDIFESLAQTCNQLDAMVRSEQLLNVPDTTSFDDLTKAGTAVGAFLIGLSAKSKPDKVESLAKLSAKETTRRDVLEQSLKADNPTALAGQCRLLSNRIAKITKSAEEKSIIVGGKTESKLRKLAQELQRAKRAAKLATQVFQQDETLLQGTGGDAWKRMFESSRSFYQEACPNQDFSHLDPQMPCPLCQQPLNDGASRLKQFDKFVQDETEKIAKERKKEFDEAYIHFTSQNVMLGLDDELNSEIESKIPTLGANTRVYEKSLVNRYAAIKAACTTNTWNSIGPVPQSPVAQLRALSEKLNAEAADLEKAADETARRHMQIEFDELEARVRFARVKTAVITAITKHSLCANLAKCLKAVKTTAISKKATEIAERVISKDLAKALNDEFTALGAENLSVSFQSRSAKGKRLHKLKLGFSQATSPRDVLSEGEQRAIAIGSFLAEVNLGGGTGGIVFDDPVSSLDHKRRERVASRLVKEALKRQVIVLTHDIYFVSLMLEEAQRAGATHVAQSLVRMPQGYGVADPKLPFEALKTKARVGELRNMQVQIAKLYKIGNEPEYRKQTFDAYRQLRIAWERAVEEVLLRSVVIRFKKGVSTQLLAGVVVEDSDYALVDSEMTKCSNYVHDQALLGGTAIPTPDELLTDINSLESWRVKVENRSEVVRRKRRSGGAKIP